MKTTIKETNRFQSSKSRLGSAGEHIISSEADPNVSVFTPEEFQ